MAFVHWTGGVVLVAIGLASGFFLGRAFGSAAVPHSSSARDGVTSEPTDRDLARALDATRRELARVKARVGGLPRTEFTPGAPSTGERIDVSKRAAAAIHKELHEAVRAKDGARQLELLAELAALGPEHYPEVVGHWIRIANLGPSALDALGLSRLDLSTALVREAGLMRFTLESTDLDPTFRRFTADTLGQASLRIRRSILDRLDFSTERDKRVMHSLVRAASDVKDESYVDRFLHMVQRTDLYNDTRSSIAFLIAEIGGEKSRTALQTLRATGKYERIGPVLQNIHAPPATGLLITNGFKPGGARIGLNDIILEYNGRTIRTMADLTRADGITKPGDVVTAKLLRDGHEVVLTIKVVDTAPGHLHFSARSITK